MQSSNDLRKTIQFQLSPIYELREADQIAALIIEHLFGIPSNQQLLNSEITFSSEIEEQTRKIVDRLLQNEPIQYVLGYTEFYGRRFKTDPRALIPRPETEELVDLILSEGVSSGDQVLDVGTGTGCIAITLALETGCHAFALDVDADTLSLADENACSLGAEINLVHADILNTKPDLRSLDLIASNPPYVPENELSSMHSRVKDFEPNQALFVADDNPLRFYQRIAELAPQYLKPGGRLYLEIYHLAGPAVIALFQGSHWSQVQLKKDLQTKDRMIKATLRQSR